MNRRVLKVQEEILTRYRRISDLWTGYYAKCTVTPEVFGREFYRATGELLQGKPLERLNLIYLKTQELESTIFPRSVNDRSQKRVYKKPRIQLQSSVRQNTAELRTHFGDNGTDPTFRGDKK